MNCHHVFPDLARLEKTFHQELVVIGVHSAKFPNERETENIRKAVLRHGIAHPVVNDADMAIWKRYGVRGWPTLMLVDPEGVVVGYVSGEGNHDLLAETIRETIAAAERKGTLSRRPVLFPRDREPERPLLFPGKVHATADRLFVSDTAHHRIVVADHTGKVLDRIGSGTEGFADGAFADARFRYPQGLHASGGKLWVADTENHRIREADLAERTVRTLAGTGEQVHTRDGGPALETPLNSPWDVVPAGSLLYVAMAGQHQVWTLDLARGVAAPWAGDGRETLEDGSRAEASFNQPSGLALGEGTLYVADAEVSGIRAVATGPGGRVRTLVGAGLFEFGDRDGVRDEVRMQHVLHVALDPAGKRLFVADSYNHKVKTLDLERGRGATCLGDGTPGATDDPPRLFEPGGLAVAGGRLFIADTNNHAVRVTDLATGKLSTLAFAGLGPPR